MSVCVRACDTRKQIAALRRKFEEDIAALKLANEQAYTHSSAYTSIKACIDQFTYTYLHFLEHVDGCYQTAACVRESTQIRDDAFIWRISVAYIFEMCAQSLILSSVCASR